PTPVGVFPTPQPSAAPSACLPHARGGVSVRQHLALVVPMSSPRPWGCFYPSRVRGFLAFVFPTPVGVFLRPVQWPDSWLSLPHARGGVSIPALLPADARPSSPRPWGCF